MRFPGMVAGLTLAALLSGCAHTVPDSDWPADTRSDINHFEQARLVVEELPDWGFSGRIAARNGSDGGQATIRWMREQDVFRLEMFGPFGGGAVRIEYGPRGATLEDGDGRRYQRESAQALLDEVVGWQVPFADLNYWLFGLASRSEPAEFVLDQDGNLARLRQSGWDIEFSSWQELGGRPMPGRIFATRMLPAPNGDSVSVRIVSRDWSET